MAKHNELGKEGEQMAVDFLIKNGYEIKERNWRFKKAEVDIIAQKNNTLVAVEVKTRSTDYFGNPQDFIKNKKINLLVNATDAYVNKNNLNVEVRFDVIAIVKNGKNYEIEHLKDAFFYF